jgi:Tfp pilus assembly PilM family ATPase
MAGAWGLEIDKGRIGLCRARLTPRGFEVTQGVSLPLPSTLITPSLTEPNVADGQALSGELRSLMKKAGCRGGPVVLTLPDTSCRVGWQDFETLSGTPLETRQLLCWRLKDRIPFPLHECRVDYQPLAGQGSGTRLFYLLAVSLFMWSPIFGLAIPLICASLRTTVAFRGATRHRVRP